MSNKPIYFGRGEDAVTEQSFLQLLATSAKRPVMYDFSHWRAIPDFSKLDPFPLLVITKATEGSTYRDATFIGYMTQMKDRGIYRGAFHFHRKAVSASAQATNFIEYTKGLLTDRDIICLDVEEGGETATQLMAWFQIIEARFPNNPLWMYSRKNILDPIVMTQSQKDYFRSKVKTWTAGYPSNVDAYSTVPDFYIPDPTKYNSVIAWQYTDRLEVGGIVEGVADANWMSPELINSYAEIPQNGGTMKKYKTLTPLNIRTAPIVADNIIQSLPVGAFFWGEPTATLPWVKGTHYQLPNEQYAIAKDFYIFASTQYSVEVPYSEPVLEPATVTRKVTVTVEEDGWKTVSVEATQEKL